MSRSVKMSYDALIARERERELELKKKEPPEKPKCCHAPIDPENDDRVES